MADDWASQFRPEMREAQSKAKAQRSEDLEATSEAEAEAGISDYKILKGFEAVLKRLDAMDARLGLFEAIIQNPSWLDSHIQSLNALHRGNAEALMHANQQFSMLVIRKLDEMEERIKADEPSYTNVLYSDPELFNEISTREDEEEVQIEKSLEAAEALIEELVEGRAPDMTEEEIVVETAAVRKDQLEQHLDIPPGNDVPLEILESYQSWKSKDGEGSWQSFVKVCGGVSNAVHYRDLIEG